MPTFPFIPANAVLPAAIILYIVGAQIAALVGFAQALEWWVGEKID